MQTIKYVHWQEDDAWLGYLEEYPNYWTQGDTLADLVEHLKDLIFVERTTFFTGLLVTACARSKTPRLSFSARSASTPSQWITC
jgi:hypothetical protein